jgi:hypothetical protein
LSLFLFIHACVFAYHPSGSWYESVSLLLAVYGYGVQEESDDEEDEEEEEGKKEGEKRQAMTAGEAAFAATMSAGGKGPATAHRRRVRVADLTTRRMGL